MTGDYGIPAPPKLTLAEQVAQACGDPGSILTRNNDYADGGVNLEPMSQWTARAVTEVIARNLHLSPCHTALCRHGIDHHLRHTAICNYQRADILDALLTGLGININIIARQLHQNCPSCTENWGHHEKWARQ